MQTIEFKSPKNLINALSEGKKLAIFEVDDEKNAIFLISEINSCVSQNSKKTDNLIAPALNYINANFYKDIKLDSLADLCDLSPSYFSRLFSATVRSSIADYVTKLRLTRACELLASTNRTVVDIACSVGYVDCGYFYKLFKKHYACTPLEYRDAHAVLYSE